MSGAIGRALDDVVKDAMLAPGTRSTLDQAIQNQLSSLGRGFTSPAVSGAIGRALDDVVKDAMLAPGTRSTLDSAVQRQVRGFGGVTSPAVSRAVSNALGDAVREVVLSPDARASIGEAIRRQTTALGRSPDDPALGVMLRSRNVAPSEELHPEETAPPKAVPTELVTEGKFSAHFSGPDSFFAGQEVVIDSFESLTSEIANLAARNPGLHLVWRGHQSASWGLHSSLYRGLMTSRGVRDGDGNAASDTHQVFPDENAMVEQNPQSSPKQPNGECRTLRP